MLPTSASFLLAEDCNMACTYCFEKDKKPIRMDVDTSLYATSMLFKNALENAIYEREYRPAVDILYFGGEPLLNKEALYASVKYAVSISEKTSIPFSFTIVTNGTLLDDTVVQFLEYIRKESPSTLFAIQISIDGVGDVHDRSRVFKDGSGSFSTISRNLDRIYHRISDYTSIHECVSHTTVNNIFESFVYFYETYGCHDQWFMPIHDESFTHQDAVTYELEMKKIIDYLISANDTSAARVFSRTIKLESCSGANRKPCGAGNGFVTITASGDIYPCHEFYYNDASQETKLGSLTQGIDIDRQAIYISYDMRDITCTKTGVCENAAMCYMCVADNYMHHKNMLISKFDLRCAFTAAEKRILQYAKVKMEELDVTDTAK